MKYIGPHVSTGGGVQNAPPSARSLGATGFGMFTKNQRQWVSAPYSQETIAAFKKAMSDNGYKPETVLAHDGYLINLGNPDSTAFQKSFSAFVDELTRCEQLGLTLLNMHPGSHLRIVSEEACLLQIAMAINDAHKATQGVTVVIENTAGQGSNVGYSFEHLAFIIKNVKDKNRIGFCLDTCHAFAAGYDLRTRRSYDEVMKQLESTVGFKYLRGVHLNDAKAELGSHLDRHQSLGKGTIGLETFAMIMNDDRFEEVPMVLETIDETIWKDEVRMLREMVQD